MRSSLLAGLVGVALLTTPPAPLSAQGGPCLRAKPRPACDGWWTFEPFAGSISHQPGFDFDRPIRSDTFYGFEVGGMLNVAPRHAAGASVVYGSLGYGLRARYRYWMSPDVGLDLMPGLLWEEHEGLTRVEVTASAMVIGWAGGFVGLSRHRQRKRWEWSVGMRAGGQPGVVLSVLGMAYLLLLSQGLSHLQ